MKGKYLVSILALVFSLAGAYFLVQWAREEAVRARREVRPPNRAVSALKGLVPTGLLKKGGDRTGSSRGKEVPGTIRPPERKVLEPAEERREIKVPSESQLGGLAGRTKETLRLRYNLGLVNLEKGDLASALDAFRGVIEIDPQGEYGRRAFIQIGIISDQLGDRREAIHSLRKAVRLDPRDPLAMHDLGLAYLHAGKIREAVTALEEAARLAPSNMQILLNLGNSYFASEEFSRALRSYEAVLQSEPRNGAAHFNRGLVLMRNSEKYAAAAASFDTAARFLSDVRERARARALAGLMYYKQGMLDEAGRRFEKAAEEDPEVPDYRFNEAVAKAQAGLFDEARGAYQKYLAIRPGDAEAWFGLGSVEFLDQRYEKSLAAFGKGLSYDTSADFAYFTVGYILLEKDQLDRAEAMFRKVVALHGPLAPRAHVNLGLIYEKRGDWKGALAEYEQGDPEDPRTFYNKGLILRRLQKNEEAVKALRRAVDLDRKDPKYATALADAYLATGRPDAAITEYERTVENGEASVEILLRLARLNLQLERLDPAGKWIERAESAARSNKERARIFLMKALLEDKRGDLAAAENDLKEALVFDKTNPDVYYNLGIIYSRQLRYDEAVDVLRVAARLEPNDARAYTQLGNIYYRRGLPEEAARMFERAVKADSQAVEAAFNLVRAREAAKRERTE
ncbi:MAG: tetratricopeptide repeat protein [Candidatus Hydrogenedentota bacterium]|nr:MAG: tetratricopeptide repeat protein [Candidatus Hydrogenedentota bacterium]